MGRRRVRRMPGDFPTARQPHGVEMDHRANDAEPAEGHVDSYPQGNARCSRRWAGLGAILVGRAILPAAGVLVIALLGVPPDGLRSPLSRKMISLSINHFAP